MTNKRGRPVSTIPRNIRKNIVITAAESALLEETANILHTTQTNTLIRGLHLLHQNCMAHRNEILGKESEV